MTIQELEHIIEIVENYDKKEVYQFFDFIHEVYDPLKDAIESNDKTIIDYLMKCTPEELFHIDMFIVEIIAGSEQPEAIKLYDKMLRNDEHIANILTALKEQSGEDDEAENLDELTYHFDISADMVEGIHLTPKQIELWEKIIEREHLIIIAEKCE